MANLRGPGAMTDVNLIARLYDNAQHTNKNGNTSYFVDVMVDGRNESAKGDPNLHIATQRTKDANGKQRISNTQPYAQPQLDKLLVAAGDNVTPIKNQAGEAIGKAFAFKGSLMPVKNNQLIVNTNKTLGASDFEPVTEQVLNNQFAMMKEASVANKAAKQAQATEAPAPTEAQVATEQVQVQQDEPSIG